MHERTVSPMPIQRELWRGFYTWETCGCCMQITNQTTAVEGVARPRAKTPNRRHLFECPERRGYKSCSTLAVSLYGVSLAQENVMVPRNCRYRNGPHDYMPKQKNASWRSAKSPARFMEGSQIPRFGFAGSDGRRSPSWASDALRSHSHDENRPEVEEERSLQYIQIVNPSARDSTAFLFFFFLRS